MLNSDELSVLEDDLKAFLIINGIDGDEWELINKYEPQKAIGLVEIFSDTVLQKVYSKIQFLEYRSPKTCIVFNCKADETELISLQLDENSKGDLSTPESIHHTLLSNSKGIQFLRQYRSHKKTREEEIHQLLEQGCVPSVRDFWVSLETVTEQNQ